MTNLTQREEPAFQSDDLVQIAGYRNISVLAIASLVLGLAAPLCFAAPVFMAIPLFGTAISLMALRRIAVSEGAMAGRWAASLGLALCLIAGLTVFSQAQATRYLCAGQARQLGQHWIKLLCSGDVEQAFKLTTAGARPEPQLSPDEPPPKQTPFDAFRNDAVVQALSTAGAGAEVRFVETVAFEPRSQRQAVVQQHFSVIPAAATATGTQESARPIDALLTLQRSHLAGDEDLRWLVTGYQRSAATPVGSGAP